MVDNIISKPLGLALIVTAHIVFNVTSEVVVTGILGTNTTLQFKFRPNVSLTNNSHFAIHKTTDSQKKIAEFTRGKEEDVFDVFPQSASVSWNITNLTLNDSGYYLASLFKQQGPAQKSNTVQLIVRAGNRSSTAPTVTPMQNNTPGPDGSGSSSHVLQVLVISPVVLLAAVLPCVIWSLMKTKNKQPPKQSSNPTIQETVQVSMNVPPSSLVYSVLDFPKRTSAVLDINPNDTEYAAVSYLPENRQV